MQGSVRDVPGDRGVLVQHRVESFSEDWVIVEGKVPEAAWHDHAAEHLRGLLKQWVIRTARDAAVFRNLAVRVRKDRPSVGFDPDVCLVVPAPPDAPRISSLRLWVPGHVAPTLVVEVVSPNRPGKDYVETPDQCAAVGVEELFVFDPLRVGPRTHGRATLLQHWRRTQDGAFARMYSGDGPAESALLGAYLLPAEQECRLRIAADPAGVHLWQTAEELAVAQKDAALAQKDAAVAQKDAALAQKDAAVAQMDAALARVRELEEELARRR